MKRRLLALPLGTALLLFLGDAAQAYPRFQLSSGTTACNLCHYAPAGGGLLTKWGRRQSAETVSMGGDGASLHGLVPLPDWLAVGGDFRGALLANDVDSSEGTELAAFPMQAEVAARVQIGKQWSVVGSVGLRGAVRHPELQPNTVREEAGPLSALISREHYVQWDGPSRLYARAGRFYAPFGLRLPDHTTYIRRYTGFNLFEETYGMSGGFVRGDSELHVTAFASDELRWSPRREIGGAALMEWRRGDLAYAVSSRVGFGEEDTRAIAGGYVKWWSEATRILWMAELDGVWQRLYDAEESRYQLVGYAGPVWFPIRGLSVAAAYELFDEDVIVEDVERHALSMWVALLPAAHFELMLSGRAQLIGTDDRALMAMLQLHYYL